jgi:hypothetical protein
MLPLHAAGEVPPPLAVRLPVAALAGLLATLGMTVVMRTQSYGYVPPYVAAGAVLRRPPEQVERSAAEAVHFGAGLFTGLFFESLLVGYERLREPAGITVEIVVARATTLSELLALAVVVAVLYAFFAWLVFPRFGGNAYETRPAVVRRQWAVSALSYGGFLFVSMAAVYAVVPV